MRGELIISLSSTILVSTGHFPDVHQHYRMKICHVYSYIVTLFSVVATSHCEHFTHVRMPAHTARSWHKLHCKSWSSRCLRTNKLKRARPPQQTQSADIDSRDVTAVHVLSVHVNCAFRCATLCSTSRLFFHRIHRHYCHRHHACLHI